MLTHAHAVLVSALLAALAVAYAVFVGGCAWRIRRDCGDDSDEASGAGEHRGAPEAQDDVPHVAVLVAARDEEAVIARCLQALLAQDYPADRLQIVVADDHSGDRTAEIVRRAADRDARAPEASGGARVRLVSVPGSTGPLVGKPLAIHAAVQATTAPVLLVTDADCAPPPTWVRGLVASLGPDIGLTSGLTLMEAETQFGHAQSLDWSYLLGVASALTEAGFPATAMGNNLAFRREAYESVGGYPGLPFSVTEDFALFKAIADGSLWRVRFPLRASTLVRTLPARSLAHAYRQRRRWARGGMRAGPTLWAAYVLAHLAHLLPLAGLLLAPQAALVTLAVKLGADAALVSSVRKRVGAEKLRPLPFALFEGFLFLYMTTLPLALLLAPRIRWKGRVH